MLLCVQSELMTYIGRVLTEAEQRWNSGEEPKREDGCYVSPVAYDIIQVQHQNSNITDMNTVENKKLNN